MYVSNLKNAMKMIVKDLPKFLFESYYKQIGFREKDSCCSFGRVKKKGFSTILHLTFTKTKGHY